MHEIYPCYFILVNFKCYYIVVRYLTTLQFIPLPNEMDILIISSVVLLWNATINILTCVSLRMKIQIYKCIFIFICMCVCRSIYASVCVCMCIQSAFNHMVMASSLIR